ncbi:hypothetical protein OAS39_05075 [Pirellulales bacterium]|nr:hypothetical protein [Pirellulales bacterium]
MSGVPWIAFVLPLAQQAPKEMPPTTRAMMLMALLGILLVGLFLIAAVLLGGHWVRRIGDRKRGPSVPPDRAPLSMQPSPEPPRPSTAADGDTIADATDKSTAVER